MESKKAKDWKDEHATARGLLSVFVRSGSGVPIILYKAVSLCGGSTADELGATLRQSYVDLCRVRYSSAEEVVKSFQKRDTSELQVDALRFLLVASSYGFGCPECTCIKYVGHKCMMPGSVTGLEKLVDRLVDRTFDRINVHPFARAGDIVHCCSVDLSDIVIRR